jgi:hypothetical protein
VSRVQARASRARAEGSRPPPGDRSARRRRQATSARQLRRRPPARGRASRARSSPASRQAIASGGRTRLVPPIVATSSGVRGPGAMRRHASVAVPASHPASAAVATHGSPSAAAPSASAPAAAIAA